MSKQEFSYQDYVSDRSFQEKYSAYQERYFHQIRESDKVLINLVGSLLDSEGQGQQVSLLDIGCSTGNLLFHLKNTFPQLDLTGGDAAASVIEKCKEEKRLETINFEVLNMLNLNRENTFDIVIANAILYMFDDAEYIQAIQNVTKVLKKTGWLILFDFCHPYEQDLKIIEKSQSHPEGLNIHFRPFSKVRNILVTKGFDNIKFQPFSIPIDLVKGQSYSDNQDGFEDLNSYTMKTESGERLLFRGTLFQPWCHLMAQKIEEIN